ncbi:MAG TPA: peptidoglycan DD-metalloendopeptidase family protein [Caulobacteraceae bacterium]|nr:peptidoglycan DD-metalloendopeptidase family protein [Caulobacteraceae bacterium]
MTLVRRLLTSLALCLLCLGAPAYAASLDDQRRALAALTAKEDALDARMGADRNVLSHLLASLELFARDPPPPLIVRAEDAKDAVNAAILAKALAAELQDKVRVLASDAAQLASLRRQAAVASGDLFASESAIEDRQGRLDAVTQDAALLAPPSVRAAVAAPDAGPAPSILTPPTAGRIAVRFGGRLSSGLAARGVAYHPAPGAAVLSPAGGVVAYAGPVNGWGEVVILRAGGGCHMVLSGLGKVTVKAGQSVAAGLPIGAMPTSRSLAPELYLEVRLAQGVIDPAPLMGGRTMDVNANELRLRREGVN